MRAVLLLAIFATAILMLATTASATGPYPCDEFSAAKKVRWLHVRGIIQFVLNKIRNEKTAACAPERIADIRKALKQLPELSSITKLVKEYGETADSGSVMPDCADALRFHMHTMEQWQQAVGELSRLLLMAEESCDQHWVHIIGHLQDIVHTGEPNFFPQQCKEHIDRWCVRGY